MNDKKHLWEIDHPYYCNLGNYFNNDCGEKYKSWDDFEECVKYEDIDLNLIFRWDWNEGKDFDLEEFNGDIYNKCGILYLFYISQRKGIYRWVEIEVCRDDEVNVKKFLEQRWNHMKKLWCPISTI